MAVTLPQKVKYSPNERLDLFDKTAEETLRDAESSEYREQILHDAQDGRVLRGYKTTTVTGANVGFTIPATEGVAVDRAGNVLLMDGSIPLTTILSSNTVNYIHAYYNEVDSVSGTRRFFSGGSESSAVVNTRVSKFANLHRTIVGTGVSTPSLGNFSTTAVIGGSSRQLVPLYAVRVTAGNVVDLVQDFRPMWAPNINGAGSNVYTADTHSFVPSDLATLGITNIRTAIVAITNRLLQLKGTTNWWDDSTRSLESVGGEWTVLGAHLDRTAGRVGIHTQSLAAGVPQAGFHFVGSGVTADDDIIHARYSSVQPYFIFHRSQGTPAAATNVGINDVLGSVLFRGQFGGAFYDAASINALVDGTPGAGDMPGRLIFSTTPDGTATPIGRVRINNNGSVDVGLTFGESVHLAPGSEWPVRAFFSSDIATNRVHFLSVRKRSTGDVVLSGDTLGGLSCGGYFTPTTYASGWDGGTEITAVAVQDWTSIARGAHLDFSTTPHGFTTPVRRMRLSHSGELQTGVGTLTYVTPPIVSPAMLVLKSTDIDIRLTTQGGDGRFNILEGAYWDGSVHRHINNAPELATRFLLDGSTPTSCIRLGVSNATGASGAITTWIDALTVASTGQVSAYNPFTPGGEPVVTTGSPSAPASWSLTTPRFFAVNYDAGSDANLGYSDASMAAAGVVAKKTIEGLVAIFPKIGAGRVAVIAINTRAAGAVYRNAANTADAELDFLRGVYGYQHILVRGTGTVATAGATAFANDTADKIALGAQIVSGTNAGGYNPTGVPTSSVFTCQLNGGGAPGLTAEPVLLGKRLRFSSTTPTVLLRNVCRMIHENDATTITVEANFPAVPSTSDIFYIEEPGVAFDRLVMSGVDGANIAMQPSFSSNGVHFAGFRLPNVTAAWVGVSFQGIGTVNVAFIDVASTGFAAVRIGNSGRTITISANYVDELNTTIVAGPGLRCAGWGTIANANGCIISSCALAAGRWQILNISGSTINIGAGSYFGLGILTQNIRGSSAAGTSVGGNVVGNNGGTSTVRRLRSRGSFSGVQNSFTNSDIFIRGIDMQNAGTASLISINGIGAMFSINDAIGSTGNTGNGLDLTGGARGCTIAMGNIQANTFTGAAGQDIAGAVSMFYVHADYAIASLRDSRGNVIHGATSTELGPTVLVSNDTFAAIAKRNIVRATATGSVRAAQANTNANASGIIGVAQGAASTAPQSTTMAATGGAIWLQFDVAPTAGALAYLSTATAGNAQVAVPAVAGTNQKLRLGQVLSVSGTTGLVAWSPDLLPVLADGVA